MSSRTRILVVEDERIIALDLCRVLEDQGYNVVGIASCSQEAVDQADKLSPDLVLMDIRLRGDRDGIQAAAALRAHHEMPIVYLTANADPATVERALATRPDGYVAKPYNVPTLCSTIEVAMRRHQFEVAAREQRASLVSRINELEHTSHELEVEAEHFRSQALLDPLTKLFNRRYMDSVLTRELSAAARESRSVGAILCDIDHFKRVNDTFGHVTGDEILREFANLLCQQIRQYDVACRFGGEEFVIVAPGASLDEAYRVAERVRKAVEALPLPVATGEGMALALSASFGVAVFPTHGRNPKDLLRAADAALYAAKAAGRNRVMCAASL